MNATQLSSIVASIASVTLACCASAKEIGERTWTVSELRHSTAAELARPSVVRGVVRAGEHGIWLQDDHCTNTCDDVVALDVSNVVAQRPSVEQLLGRGLHSFERRYVVVVEVRAVFRTPPVPTGQPPASPRLSSLVLLNVRSVRPWVSPRP
jgi:hypothetical protein